MAGSVREQRPGVWEVRASLGRDPVTGKRRTLSRLIRATGKRDAQRKLAALVNSRAVMRGTDETVEYLLARYLEHLTGELSPSTVLHYRRRVNSRLIPALGHLSLRKLNAGHLDGFYDALKKAGRAPSDIRQYHAIMRGALNRAVDWGWVDENVALRAHPPKARANEIDPPDAELILAIIDSAERGTGHPNSPGNPALACYLRVVAATGCRRGEACALRWSDFNNGVVTIRRNIVDALGRGVPVVVKDTKTHAIRSVSLDEGTVAVLAEHAERAQAAAAATKVKITKDAYVFSHEPDGSQPWRPEYATLCFRRIVKHLGHPEVRLHDLRHAHLSLLFDSGLPVHAIQRRAGHKVATTTLNIYGHGRDERDPEAAAITGRALGPAPVVQPK